MKENKLNTLLDNEEIIDLRLSYSKVSDFDRNGPISLIRKSNVENEGVKHGSLVDTLLVDKLTEQDSFNQDYLVLNIEKPTAMLGTLCDIILNNRTEIPSKEEVLQIVNTNGLWGKYKEETKIATFDIPQFWEYLNLKFSSINKIVVTPEQYDKAKESVEILLTHEFTKDLFYNEQENYYQVEFNLKYKGFTFKGFLDKMTIDRINKVVYFQDIKTGENKNDKFMKSFIDYRYYFQGLIYQMAYETLSKQYDFEGYTLANFMFIYVGKTENHPLIWVMTDKWIKAAQNGFKTASGFIYRGLDELLDEIYYHWKRNKYDFTKKVYEWNGMLELNDDFIEVNG